MNRKYLLYLAFNYHTYDTAMSSYIEQEVIKPETTENNYYAIVTNNIRDEQSSLLSSLSK